MEIILGSIRPLSAQNTKPIPKNKSGPITARLLHVRAPRKGISGPSGMERRTKQVKDPPQGRVLTIMVPDGSLLPSDIDNAQYDLSIRLIRR